MANVAQATFIGGQIIIECNEDWDCCQREQAREKCRRANTQLERARENGTPACVRSTADTEAAKAGLYSNALEQARENITGNPEKGPKTKSPQQQADAAKAAGAPKCVTDGLANGTVDCDNLAMDHTLEVKLGGNVWPGPGDIPLLPLDRGVNGAFGSLMKNTANAMGDGTEVEEISLVCPPNGSCPQRGYSTGSVQKTFPASAAEGDFVTTAATPDYS
jgi:hypothetical protein